jgi:hypothetical protein
MATIYKSQQSQGARPPVTISQAGQAFGLRGFLSVPIAFVLNDTVQLLKWPANTVIEDFFFDFDIVDSNAAPAAILQIGVLNAALTAIAGPVFVASTTAQSHVGGVLGPNTLDLNRATAKPVDRFLGMLVQTGPATGLAPTAVTLNRGGWVAGLQYNAGDYLILANGSTVKCTTPGVSGATQPEWFTANAATTTDGGVTWTSASVVVALTAIFRNQTFGA